MKFVFDSWSSINRLFLFSVLAGLLASCGGGGTSISTHTPTASMTPTCEPNILLSTPEGWGDTVPAMYVILYDPRSTQIENLELEYISGATTRDAEVFAFHLANESLLKNATDVHVSIFKLGYRRYEDARQARFETVINRPPLYNTPAPGATITPHPTSNVTPGAGLLSIQATNQQQNLESTQTVAAHEIIQQDACARIQWEEIAQHTATAWAATEQVEIARATATLQPGNQQAGITPTPTPYLRDVVYDGLFHATLDFQSECEAYERCILIIIDDLRTWGTDNPNNLDIDLAGVEIFAIMPDCRDINQPTCLQLQDYWTAEFTKFGAVNVEYTNGERAQHKLETFLGGN